MSFHAGLDLSGPLQVKPLLERAKAGAAVLAQADDLAVDNDRPREAGAQRFLDIWKLKVLRLVVAAEEREVLAVEDRQNAQAVEFRLEDPCRIVERLGNQGSEHRRWGRRHRARLQLAGKMR